MGGSMTGYPARGASAPRALPASVVTVAWTAALAAVVIGVLAGQDWSDVLRQVITAAVYAPVAAVLLRIPGHLVLGGIMGVLAVSNGVLALVVMLAGLGDGAGALVLAVALVARLPEVAALGIVPWLLAAPSIGRARRAGLWVGAIAVGLDLLLSLLRSAGLALPPEVILLPLVLALASLAAAVVVLARQRRRATSGEREALAWFGAGAALLLLSYTRVAASLSPLGLTLADAIFVLAQSVLPTGILALGLYGREDAREDRIFSGVVVAQSLAVGVSLYLVAEQAAALVGLAPEIAGAFGAAVLAVTYSSVTGFIRRRAPRLCFPSPVDARDVLTRLGDRLDGAGSDAEGAIRALAEALRDSWGLSSVRLAPVIDAPAVLTGRPDAAAASIELSAGTRPVAVLEVTAPDAAELEARVLPVLREVAPLLAVAVLLANVNTEVTETRRRTLGVRREERRMLSRELLDGLAPALAGIGFGMAGAAHRLAAGSAVGAEIAVLRAEVAAGASDVRRLARSLLPTALDAGDLDAALADFAQRLAGDGVPVVVRSAGADVLDGDQQVSIYLALSGMLSRLVRLDGVSAIQVDLTISDARVLLEVVASCEAHAGAIDPLVQEAASRMAREVGGTLEAAPAPRGSFRVVMRR